MSILYKTCVCGNVSPCDRASENEHSSTAPDAETCIPSTVHGARRLSQDVRSSTSPPLSLSSISLASHCTHGYWRRVAGDSLSRSNKCSSPGTRQDSHLHSPDTETSSRPVSHPRRPTSGGQHAVSRPGADISRASDAGGGGGAEAGVAGSRLGAAVSGLSPALPALA